MRVALVDVDAGGLDRWRESLARSLGARDGEWLVARLVIDDDPGHPAWRWAGLAGVPRAGEVAALGEVVVEAVAIGRRSPRAETAARLASSLGARVFYLTPDELPVAGAEESA